MKPFNRLVWALPLACLAACGRGDQTAEPSEPVRAGLLVGESSAAQTVTVTIRGMAFNPAYIEAGPGTTVVFINADDVVHTATAVDGSWSSGDIPPGGSWRRRFIERATYSFYCRPHPNMTGTLAIR